MTFFVQHRQDSFLERANPSVKLIVAFLISLLLVAVFDPWTPLLLYLAGLAVVVILARLPWRVILLAHVPFATFALSVLWVNLFFRTSGAVVLAAGPLTITEGGLQLGTSLALRTMVIGVISIAFVLTTEPGRLTTSLVQNLRLSPRFAYGILAAYRFLPTLQSELAIVRHARALRRPRRVTLTPRRSAGAHLPTPHPLRGRRVPLPLTGEGVGEAVQEWLSLPLPLLVSAIRRAERVAIALESRGAGGERRRTFWRPEPVRASDIVFAIGCLSFAAAVVIAMVWLGLFRGFEAVTVF